MTSAARSLLDRVQRVVAHAREVTDHPVLEAVARIGLIAYGVVHLLIGWLALQLAWAPTGPTPTRPARCRRSRTPPAAGCCCG